MLSRRNRSAIAPTVLGTLAVLCVPPALGAQEPPPDSAPPLAAAPDSGEAVTLSGLVAFELERSRRCVGTLARLDTLNRRLQPLGLRAERLRRISEAVAIEDRAFVDSLDVADELEKAVRDWFVADGRLAQSYAETRNEEIQRQRAVGREQVKTRLQQAMQAVQDEARSLMEADPELPTDASACDGALFIRPAVLEVCATQESPICGPARSDQPDQQYRFVESPQDLWDVQELRPWTRPGPLQLAPDGSLTGARTTAFSRRGNVVFAVTFGPFIRPRSALSEEQLQDLTTLVDSLGLAFDHPDLLVAPSIAVQATLPQPLAGETVYVLHFGTPDDADIVWSGPAGTGENVEATVVLEPRHVARLMNGELLRLTAVRSGEGEGANEAVFSLELTTVNQASAVRALLGYMASQLNDDLKRLIPPGGGG